MPHIFNYTVLPHKNQDIRPNSDFNPQKGIYFKTYLPHGSGESHQDPSQMTYNHPPVEPSFKIRPQKQGGLTTRGRWKPETCETCEAYLQGLSVGLATLGGSDGWLRFILDPSMDEAGKVRSDWRMRWVRLP